MCEGMGWEVRIDWWVAGWERRCGKIVNDGKDVISGGRSFEG